MDRLSISDNLEIQRQSTNESPRTTEEKRKSTMEKGSEIVGLTWQELKRNAGYSLSFLGMTSAKLVSVALSTYGTVYVTDVYVGAGLDKQQA